VAQGWYRRVQMGIDDRMDSESENYHRPGGAAGTPRELPDPTDEDFIEIASALYEAVGDDVEVFAQAIGMDHEGAEEVIARIRESRGEGNS
jgi:hypothetical protein